jgi:3-oxoacyl-[acyl-carrier protein] reductase
MKLKDKTAIITGSASGIGKAAALLFAKEGAKVVVCDVSTDGVNKVVEEINGAGGQALAFTVDVSNRESIDGMVKEVIEKFGEIDVLVNNAGITRDALLVKMTADQWDKVIDVNLKGVFNCTQAVVKSMISKGKGKIISTSSVVGVYGNVGQTNYAATKAGIIGMTKSWSKELGKKGICCNAVAPGFIQTEMTAAVPDKILDIMKEKTPLGRLGTPGDIASVYLFLASDDSDYVNGQVIGVDGGLVI